MNKLWKYTVGILSACYLAFSYNPTQAAENTALPILMYHNITEDSSKTSSMTVTVARFRHDMEFLSEYGYTPLLSSDLINIKSGAKQMPQRPVMITFDDGYESNYLLGFPILKETGMKATIALITSHIRDGQGNGLISSLTWEQAREMYQSGIVDIGSHTHSLHNESNLGFATSSGPNGIQRQRGESYSAFQQRVGGDIAHSVSLIKQWVDPNMNVWYFSYPFGAADSWFGQILLDNRFYVSTVTVPKTANISNGLYGLPRHRIMMDKTVSQLLQHTVTASPTVIKVALDEQETRLPAYQIEGSNYVKLRDVAAMLSGTSCQFSISWENDNILLHTGVIYTPVGGERVTLPPENKTGKSMIGQVNIDGQYTTMAAYNIADNYYFKLRSLSDKLGFFVAYDADNQVVLVKTSSVV